MPGVPKPPAQLPLSGLNRQFGLCRVVEGGLLAGQLVRSRESETLLRHQTVSFAVPRTGPTAQHPQGIPQSKNHVMAPLAEMLGVWHALEQTSRNPGFTELAKQHESPGTETGGERLAAGAAVEPRQYRIEVALELANDC